ncbi:MFS transporter [Myxococcota bacterium]|nr:MFS transporter [Myxococcota bacterium]
MTEPENKYSETYLRYVLGVVFLIAIFNTMDRTVVSVLMQDIKAELALTDFQLGLISGPAFAIVHFLAGIPIARLADRRSRRNIIAVGVFVWSAMTAATGIARDFTQLILTRMGVGIGEAAGSPPSASLMSDYFPPERRARAMSMLTIGSISGLGLGLVLGGVLGENYGWRNALIFLGLPGIVVALIVRFTVREPPRGYSEPGGGDAQAPPPSISGVIRYLVSIPSFRWIVLAACLSAVTSFGKNLWEPTFLIRTYGLSPGQTGVTYFLISAVPAAIGAWIGAVLADRFSVKDERYALWLCAGGNVAVYPSLLGFLLWPAEDMLFGVPVAFYFSVLASLAGGFFSPVTIAMAQNIARPSMRALTHALWSMMFNLVGMGLGPMLVGALSSHWETTLGLDSLRYALVVVSLAILPSAGCFLMSARTLREDLAAARA